MVRNEWPGAVEYWYRNAETKRHTVVSAEDEAWIGTYELFANGRISGCITHPQEQYCWDDPLEAVPADAVYSQVPQELVEASCTEAGEATEAGRSARHFLCEGVEFAIAEDEYYAIDDPRITSEYWYDVDSSVLLRSLGTGQDVEATLLDLNPVFPEGVFDYVELVPPPDRLGVGHRAPLWSGPLVGGGQFDLAQVQGNPVVVFNWFPTCGDGCVEGLDLMQRLYDRYTGEIEFVTVSEDTESETARLLERQSNTVPAVFCVAEASPYTDPACATPESGIDWEASPWSLWGNSIPSTTVLDAEGVAVAIYTGHIEYGDQLDELLAQIAGVNP
jgi:peroxiredoxin